jgi:hypothetical protein
MERSSLLNGFFPTDGFFSPIKKKDRKFELFHIIPKYIKTYKKVAQEK